MQYSLHNLYTDLLNELLNIVLNYSIVFNQYIGINASSWVIL